MYNCIWSHTSHDHYIGKQEIIEKGLQTELYLEELAIEKFMGLAPLKIRTVAHRRVRIIYYSTHLYK